MLFRSDNSIRYNVLHSQVQQIVIDTYRNIAENLNKLWNNKFTIQQDAKIIEIEYKDYMQDIPAFKRKKDEIKEYIYVNKKIKYADLEYLASFINSNANLYIIIEIIECLQYIYIHLTNENENENENENTTVIRNTIAKKEYIVYLKTYLKRYIAIVRNHINKIYNSIKDLFSEEKKKLLLHTICDMLINKSLAPRYNILDMYGVKYYLHTENIVPENIKFNNQLCMTGFFPDYSDPSNYIIVKENFKNTDNHMSVAVPGTKASQEEQISAGPFYVSINNNINNFYLFRILFNIELNNIYTTSTTFTPTAVAKPLFLFSEVYDNTIMHYLDEFNFWKKKYISVPEPITLIKKNIHIANILTNTKLLLDIVFTLHNNLALGLPWTNPKYKKRITRLFLGYIATKISSQPELNIKYILHIYKSCLE